MHYTYICSYACFRFCKGVPSGTHLKAPNTHVPNSCPWCIVVLWQENGGSPEAADAAEARQSMVEGCATMPMS